MREESQKFLQKSNDFQEAGDLLVSKIFKRFSQAFLKISRSGAPEENRTPIEGSGGHCSIH